MYAYMITNVKICINASSAKSFDDKAIRSDDS